MTKLRNPRMTRHLWTVLLVSIVLAGAPLLIPAPAHPSAVTRANFDKLQQGMTGDEVEAVLGVSGNYSRNRSRAVGQSGMMFRRYWVSDEGTIIVEMGPAELGLDGADRVAHKVFYPPPAVSCGELWLRRCGLL